MPAGSETGTYLVFGSWVEADIAGWSAEPKALPDVLFSNAAIQWVPDHEKLVPALMGQVAPGGALAIQTPANIYATPHRLMRELATRERWREKFPEPPREWHAHPAEFYYDLLSPAASRIDMWFTDYLHVMDGVPAIVEWYRGTGLRPWLDALPEEASRREFLEDYRAALVSHFSARADGRVIFPFRRLFIVAYR